MLASKFGVVPGPASLKDAPSQRDALPTTGLRRRSHTVVTGGWYHASYTGLDAGAILVIALIVVACQDKLLAPGGVNRPPRPSRQITGQSGTPRRPVAAVRICPCDTTPRRPGSRRADAVRFFRCVLRIPYISRRAKCA